jgi:outer membrane autotransporter protein
MNNHRSSLEFTRVSLVRMLVVSPVFFLSSPLLALTTVDSGQSLNIDNATTTDNYLVRNGGALNATGAQTYEVFVERGSSITATGGTFSGRNGNSGLNVSNSQATVTGATLTSDTSALWLTRQRPTTTGSSALVTDSILRGGTAGVLITGLSSLELMGGEVTGVQANSVGIEFFGGEVKATGTTISGGLNGVRLGFSGSGLGETSLTLDGSILEGRTSSAILLEDGAQVNINVLNNSTLLAGNGILLDVQGASTASMNVANSELNGNISIADGSTGNLNFNQGRMAGDVQVTDSTATVAFANGSSLEGNVNFAGGSNVDLSFDQSQLDSNVQVAGNSTAQMALNNSTFVGNLNISEDSTANLTLNRSQMTGDVVPDGSNTTESVTLENQSQLTGRLDKVKSVNINSQSNWTLTGNDTIGTLAMNGGSVAFGAAEATSTYYTLNVGTLAGTTGTFAMKADFVSGESDKLIVAGQSTGDYGLAVAASGLDAVAPEQVVLVRTGTSDGASFALAGNRAVDLGTWSYSLASRTNAEGGKEWYLDPTTETISPGAQSILALFNTPITSWYGEQSSLRTRMGELRLNGGQSGGWMRTYGSQYNVADGSGVGYQQNQQGISLGADARLGDSGWLLGVLAGTSKSDLNLDHGTTGTVNSYYVGPYLTWMSDTGYYFDGVLKFNRFRNESKVNLSDGTRSKGDYDNWGLGASAEFGRQISFGKGWFVEPFTQVSAVQIQGKRYSLDNDMTADGDTTRSLLGKAGATVGRNFEFGEGSIAQPYLRVAIAHEFAKNNEVKVNDNVFNNDLSGTRGEFGAGVAVAMSEKWQVHADFEYSDGEHIEKPLGATVGVRWFW